MQTDSEHYPFKTLPDYLAPGLNLVFIGINPGLYSVEKGHYFARSTSRFWPAFSNSKLSEPIRKGLNVSVLRPEHDTELLRFGVGFTDTVKRPTANAAGLTRSDFATWIPILLKKLQNYQPRVACFHGITAYRPFLEFALQSPGRKPILGEQAQMIGTTRLFVVPNPSPANAHFTVRDQTSWYDHVFRLLDQLKS